MNMECPDCNLEMQTQHKRSEYWIDDKPYPDDQYFLFCGYCGYKIEIMPWEYEYIRTDLKKEVI